MPQAQATLTIYLVTFGLAQFVFGPIADHLGRKPPLLLGLGIFVMGSLLCYFSPSIDVLYIGRVLQGLGAASGMVIPRAIVRDIDAGAAGTRIMGSIMMVVSVSPMIAPLVGSGAMAIGGWRFIFLVLVLLGLLGFVLTVRALPETLSADARVPIRLTNIANGVRSLLTDPVYLGLTFVAAFGMGSFFVFFANASFVYTGLYGLSPLQFSFAFAVNGVGFFLATRFVGQAAEHVGLARVVTLGVTAFMLTTLALLAFILHGHVSLAIVIAFLFVAFASLGFVLPPTMIMALEKHQSIAGLASSLGGTLQVVTAGGLIALSKPLFDGSAKPMIFSIALCALIAFVITHWTLRRGAHTSPTLSLH